MQIKTEMKTRAIKLNEFFNKSQPVLWQKEWIYTITNQITDKTNQLKPQYRTILICSYNTKNARMRSYLFIIAKKEKIHYATGNVYVRIHENVYLSAGSCILTNTHKLT